LAAEATDTDFVVPRKVKKVMEVKVLPKLVQRFYTLWQEQNPG
jgi:hypothetical protein